MKVTFGPNVPTKKHKALTFVTTRTHELGIPVRRIVLDRGEEEAAFLLEKTDTTCHITKEES